MALVLTGTSGASNLDSTNGLQFATWTTGTRPASPIAGQMGYNTTTNAFDAYVNGAWVSIATSSTAPTSGPAFSAYPSSNQSIPNASYTKLLFQNETFDTNNCFASSTFTPTTAGYYFFVASAFANAGSDRPAMNINKNGAAQVTATQVSSSAGGGTTLSVSGLISANGTTDYFDVNYYQGSGGTITLNGSANITYFQGYFVRPA
jgi:hypothetical protein